MFLQQLKENIKLNSKPFAALRNEVVSYLISHEDDNITNETIRDILEKNGAYVAAKYDIQNRFLSFSAGYDMDEALLLLLRNNYDLVHQLHAMMAETVNPKISAIAYQQILANVRSLDCTSILPLENTRNAFYDAQDFLSRHQNFTALAVHFSCTKRLGSIIEILCDANQKDAELIKYVAVPFINIFDLESRHGISDNVMADMISNLLKKLPDFNLSNDNVSQIESLLDQADKKLLTHISREFSNEKDGISMLFNSITSYFFVDKYSLAISEYVFDLFIISSSEFSTGDVRLPKIETWRNWICTCVLLEFSSDLLNINTANQILSHIDSTLIACLQLQNLQKRLKDHFVQPFKDFYSLNDGNLASLIKPKWAWDENVIPLTEDVLIDRESKQLLKDAPENGKIPAAPDLIESLNKTSTTPKVVKVEREHGVVDMLFRKTKKKERNVSILESAETNTIQANTDLTKDMSKKGSENVTENKAGQVAVEVDRAENTDKQKNIKERNTSSSEEKNKLKGRASILEHKESYTCDVGYIIQESVQNIQKVFGLSDSNVTRISDIENILSQFANSGDDSFKGKILSVQTSLFQKEMTTSEIMQLSVSDRELYFQTLENLKLDSRSASAVKSRKKSYLEKAADQTIKEVLHNTLKAIEFSKHSIINMPVFVEDDGVKTIKSAGDGAKVWRKAEVEVQSQIWGRHLSREELQKYLKPDIEDDSIEAEKKRRANRDEYIRRLNNKISKLI